MGHSLQGAPRCVRNLEHLYVLVYRWQAGSSSRALTAAKNYVTKNLERFRHWACRGSPGLPAAAAPAACAAARPAWLLPWLTPQPWRQPLPQPAGNSTHTDDWVVLICHHAMHVLWKYMTAGALFDACSGSSAWHSRRASAAVLFFVYGWPVGASMSGIQLLVHCKNRCRTYPLIHQLEGGVWLRHCCQRLSYALCHCH